MPQVAKTEEQTILEGRIARTRAMLTNMNAQLRSLRSRNKAARERERRANNVNAKKRKAEDAFDTLVAEVAAEKKRVQEVHDYYKSALANEGIDADIHNLNGANQMLFPDLPSRYQSEPSSSSSQIPPPPVPRGKNETQNPKSTANGAPASSSKKE